MGICRFKGCRDITPTKERDRYMTKSARTYRIGMVPKRQMVELASPPAWVKPQLAKLVEKAPDGPDWLHEIKMDGYRMHVGSTPATRKS
jgi:ATP-dependent DNA ligase